MWSPKAFLVVGVAVSAAWGFAYAQGALRLTGSVGETHIYKLSAELVMGEGTAKVTGDLTRKIIHTDPDGALTITESRTKLSMDLAGNQVSAPDAVLTRVMRPDGTTQDLRGEGTGPAAFRAATLTTIKLPDFPLAVGKTWSWDVPANAKTGVVKAKAEYQVLGEEKLHDIDTWKISASVVEQEGASPASSTSTVWLGKTDALLVKSESSVKNLPIPNVGPMTGTQTVDLVPKS